MNPGAEHEPVLSEEVIRYLNPRPDSVIVDCTAGYGGHSEQIIKRLGGGGVLVGIELDALALEAARRRIVAPRTTARVKLLQGNFADLTSLLQHAHVPPPGGILLDLGASTPQLLNSSHGMSWDDDRGLDMRLDPSVGPTTAADIVNEWKEEELSQLFREIGQERWSRRIARTLVRARTKKPIRTGRELGELVAGAIPRKAWPPRIHPATRVFLALRTEVNRELENLKAVLPQAVEALAPGGRLVAISFNSNEDRIVKRFLKERAASESEAPWPLPQRGSEAVPELTILTRRPVRPSEKEIALNPRSRSARLRAAEKNEPVARSSSSD